MRWIATKRRDWRVSLAKGPAGLIGVALVAYGVTGLLFGGSSFDTDALDGDVSGETWLGIEGNGWTNVVFIGAGAILLAGASGHRSAKAAAVVSALVLGAAAVIALVDDDVLGIAAANGWTIVAWGATALLLLGVAALPRVGRVPPDDEIGPTGLPGLPSDRADEPRWHRSGDTRDRVHRKSGRS